MKITIWIFLLSCLSASAQPGKKYVSMTDPHSLDFGLCDLSQYEVLDTTQLCVTYELTSYPDSTAQVPYKNKMMLEIGMKYAKYYSLLKFLNDKFYTMFMQGQVPSEKLLALQNNSGNGGENCSAIIFHNYALQQLDVTQFIPFSGEQTIIYQEPEPTLNWSFSTVADTVLGYPCYRAESDFRGRHYIAWYTPDIPMTVGPWKFSGLPGLILKITDNQQYFQWQCVAVEQKQTPIFRFKYPSQNSTREKFLDYERQYHQSPKSVLGRGGQIIFSRWDKATQTGIDMDDSWIIPYNPIEKE